MVHHYYKCVSVKKKRTECHKKPVKKDWIEDLVVAETMKMVMDDKAIEAIVSMLMDLQDRDNVNVPLYEQQLRETETAINNLLNAIQQGILTRSTMNGSHSLNYQKLGKELMSVDELAVLDGGKCILQLRGVRPFLSNKYDLTKHPLYRYTADYDKKYAFDIERFLSHRLKLKPDDAVEVYQADLSGEPVA